MGHAHIRLRLVSVALVAAAACALGQEPVMTQPADDIEALLVKVGSVNDIESQNAARELGKLIAGGQVGKENVRARTALTNLMLKDKGEASHEAMWSLRLMGMSSLPSGLEALASDTPAVRVLGAQLLGGVAEANPDKLDQFSKAVTELGKLVKDESVELRSAAIQAISAMGKDAAGPLVAALGNPPPTAKDRSAMLAAEGLARIGKPAAAAVIDALGSSDANTRRMAAYALGLMKDAAAEAVEPLTKALADKEPVVAACAAWSLGRIGAAAKSANPRLVELLADKKLLPTAADALKRIGIEAKQVDAVIEAFDLAAPAGSNDLSQTQMDLAQAAAGCGADAVTPLAAAIEDKRSAVRRCACHTLGLLGPKAAPATPALAKALKDDAARPFALRALVAIGPGAKDAAPDLVALLKADKFNIPATPGPLSYQSPAAKALAAIGYDSLLALLAGLKAQDEPTMAGCFYAMARIGKPAGEGVVEPLLRAIERCKHPYARALGVEALIAVGADKACITPILDKLSREPEVAKWAVEAAAQLKNRDNPPATSPAAPATAAATAGAD